MDRRIATRDGTNHGHGSEEEGYWRKKYKSVKYVSGSELVREFFCPVEKVYLTMAMLLVNMCLNNQNAQRIVFNKREFKRLDDILKVKLTELESCATDKEKADERVRESERKLKWIEEIKAKVESILEI